LTVSEQKVSLSVRGPVIYLQRKILWFSRHWLAWANLAWGMIVGLPWLAPVLMRIGAIGPARAIYFAYSFLCHQLANRSFFLFGPKWTYSYMELLSYLPDIDIRLGLRAFIGAPELGYKVAWSDRMVSLFLQFVGAAVHRAALWAGGDLDGVPGAGSFLPGDAPGAGTPPAAGRTSSVRRAGLTIERVQDLGAGGIFKVIVAIVVSAETVDRGR